ncbi:putative fad dependent [Phaeomoniella chlamydospora]|uniref:Putative fad dependent n=1 Tax=Phaeomoniella chlamydospora TaxID=158046 RepID=A0A0G2HA93_PHACM|nr:putative fad dependent [Phaeomoniella chlamydospora]
MDTACNVIDSALPDIVAFPVRDLVRFYDELHNYWSQADSDLYPTCITFPVNANQTSFIVKVLNNYTDVKFAMKSGGHNTNQGWSSVSGGILIAFSSNAATNLSSDGLTADIGPGARWEDVMSALDPYNKAVVGGRIGDVGVGGYILGGGLSFLSAEYGMACDTVVNFEVVLADATIVNANATSHSDLYFALKGGGNQFGMVTKITMKAIHMDYIWGGVRTYLGSDTVASTFINATHSFVTNYTDKKASVIVTTERTDLINLWVVFYFYNGPEPPNGTFAEFETMTPLTDSVKTQRFVDLLVSNNDFNLEGLRYLIRGTTLPNLPRDQGKALYTYQYTSWADQAVSETLLNADFIYNSYGRRTYAGVAPTHYGGVTADSEDVEGDSGLTYQDWNPIFMNDAMYDQTPLQTYPLDEYEKLVSAKTKYDPNGFFTNRTGGFKF